MNAKVFNLASRPSTKHITHVEVSPLTKDVPMPETLPRRRYPIPDMEVGDSFTYPAKRRSSVTAATSKFKLKFPKREFTWRVEGDRIRLWRIK